MKHTPIRTCIGCRQTQSKRSLIRLVRTADGVVVDPTGKRAGRGAYVHAERSCWEAAFKGGQLERALRIRIGAETRNMLVQELSRLTGIEADGVAQEGRGRSARAE
ncbi:MAG: YlxR family protein [Caldilinea sp.]|nr:YlxR family protein [Caldilinea sp.]MDW8441898.1 YlxR family protein [Caldilineaceae bacterium]